jgi:hypothetical protein
MYHRAHCTRLVFGGSNKKIMLTLTLFSPLNGLLTLLEFTVLFGNSWQNNLLFRIL